MVHIAHAATALRIVAQTGLALVTVSAAALLAAMPAASQTVDRFILIQPIQVCDDGGANCATITNFPPETRAIYAQAGVFPVFLTPIQLNSSAELNGLTGVDPIDDDDGGGSETVIEAWFVNSLDDGDADPSTNLFGEAWIDGNGIIINASAVSNFNGGNGRRDTFAHELGHNLGLDHNDFGAGGADNLMTAGATRNIPTGVGDINPNGAQVDQLTADQITEIRDRYVQTAVDCNGTAGPDVITKGNGDVCQNFSGLADNDTMSLAGGALVMGNMSGNEGNDTLNVTLTSFVLGNLDGGAGDDTILISDASEIGWNDGDVLGGIGNDGITIDSNSIIYGDVFGDDGNGNEADGDGNDVIKMLGGQVGSDLHGTGGNINGEGGDDDIQIFGGSVAGNVLGGSGNDKIETKEPATIAGNVDGGAGNDTITIASDPADVLGGIGDDTVNILAGAVAVNVFGDDGDGNEANGDGADTINMTGGAVSGNVDGEGGVDQLLISGGTIAGNVLGGGGGDTITTSGTAAITGNIDGEDGNDTMSVATSAANVLGGNGDDGMTINAGANVSNVFGDNNDGNDANGDGADTITMNGGTVAANVDGEGGIDTIAILGGSVGANVLGGAGGDSLTVNGGSVTGDVSGEEDNDKIFITSGSVGGNVLGGTGLDEVDLGGGTVALNVDTGADADKVTLHGTAVSGDVLTQAGNDTMSWTSGTIAAGKNINMGADTDVLDIHGTADGGTALQAALASLDGGDDASSADGQVDTLNLHGVVETLTQMNNWEFINLLDNSRGDLGAVSRTITTEIFSIDAASALIAGAGVGGQVYTIAGILDNKGGLAMSDSGAFYDEVAVTSDYRATTGALASFDTFLGADGSPSDLLRVGGATTGDPTGLVIFDTNPGAGAFTPLGIELVRVEGPAGSTAAEDFFLTAGPIEKGLWTYDLGLDNTRANPGRANADVHVLYSRPDEITQFTPYFATAALTIFETSLEPWIDRQYTLHDTLAMNRHVTPTADIGQPVPMKGTFVDLWAAPFGLYREVEADSVLSFFEDTFSARMDYDQTVWGILGGIDVISIIDDDSAVMGGVFGGYLNSSVNPDAVAVSGDYEGGTIGAYGSYLWQGLTLSAVGKVDLLKFGWDSSSLNIKENADVDTWGGRVEAAYKLALGEAPWIEPYGNLTYADSSWDSFEVLGTEFDLDDNDSLVGRLGLRVGADFYGTTDYAKVFIGGGVAEQFEDGTTADLVSGGATLPLSDDIDDTVYEVLGGFKFGGTEHGLSVTVTGTGQFSDSIEGYGGKATVNYQF